MSSLSDAFNEVKPNTVSPTVVATPSNMDNIMKKRSEELSDIKANSDNFFVDTASGTKTLGELVREKHN